MIVGFIADISELHIKATEYLRASNQLYEKAVEGQGE